jgi:hypothetical protein
MMLARDALHSIGHAVARERNIDDQQCGRLGDVLVCDPITGAAQPLLQKLQSRPVRVDDADERLAGRLVAVHGRRQREAALFEVELELMGDSVAPTVQALPNPDTADWATVPPRGRARQALASYT